MKRILGALIGLLVCLFVFGQAEAALVLDMPLDKYTGLPGEDNIVVNEATGQLYGIVGPGWDWAWDAGITPAPNTAVDFGGYLSSADDSGIPQSPADAEKNGPNGGGAYVNLGNPSYLKITGDLTVEAWINQDIVDGPHAIFGKTDDFAAGGYIAYWLYTNSGHVVAQVSGDGSPFNLVNADVRIPNTITGNNSGKMAKGVWYHVAMTVDTDPSGTTLKAFVNGVEGASEFNSAVTSVFGDPGSNLPFQIGRVGWNVLPSTPAYFFEGTIDNVKVYNHTLTPAEINAEYTAGIGGYDGGYDAGYTAGLAVGAAALAECENNLAECEEDLDECLNPPCPTLAEAISLVGAAADAACPSGGSYKNHGAYVSCVSHAVETALTTLPDGCFSASELDDISSAVVSARARSQVGK